MNNYDDYIIMGEVISNKNKEVTIPPKTAKKGPSVSDSKGNPLKIQVLSHNCKGPSKKDKPNNRILRDGKDIKDRRSSGQEQGDR